MQPPLPGERRGIFEARLKTPGYFQQELRAGARPEEVEALLDSIDPAFVWHPKFARLPGPGDQVQWRTSQEGQSAGSPQSPQDPDQAGYSWPDLWNSAANVPCSLGVPVPVQNRRGNISNLRGTLAKAGRLASQLFSCGREGQLHAILSSRQH